VAFQGERAQSKINIDGSKPCRRLRFEQFCHEYIKSQNASQAAKACGYKHTDAVGWRLKNNKFVLARIEFLLSKTVSDTIWDAKKIKEKIQGVIDDDKSKAWDRLKGLELLCKTQALLLERVKHEGIPAAQPTIVVATQKTADALAKIMGPK